MASNWTVPEATHTNIYARLLAWLKASRAIMEIKENGPESLAKRLLKAKPRICVVLNFGSMSSL